MAIKKLNQSLGYNSVQITGSYNLPLVNIDQTAFGILNSPPSTRV